MSAARFAFVTDDDGHNYLIPADKRAAWEAWVDAGDYDDGEPSWATRINSFSAFSFTDPQEDD